MNSHTPDKKPLTAQAELQAPSGVVCSEFVRPSVAELEHNLESALGARMRHEYRHGLEDGLAVANKIRGWLTRQPDRKWQKQVREWADKEIERVMRELA